VYGTGSIDAEGVERAKAGLAARMRTMFSDAPIPYRSQNGGDYPDRHVLADGVAPGVTGLRAHLG
jgi:NAD(P)H dehydrogenase (quinone)